jgi:hypothetical protein
VVIGQGSCGCLICRCSSFDPPRSDQETRSDLDATVKPQ